MSVAHAPTAPRFTPLDLTGEQVAYLIAAALVATGASMTVLFGLPGLAMTALALVPVVYVVLLLITVGK
jgi:hypothetical protein